MEHLNDGNVPVGNSKLKATYMRKLWRPFANCWKMHYALVQFDVFCYLLAAPYTDRNDVVFGWSAQRKWYVSGDDKFHLASQRTRGVCPRSLLNSVPSRGSLLSYLGICSTVFCQGRSRITSPTNVTITIRYDTKWQCWWYQKLQLKLGIMNAKSCILAKFRRESIFPANIKNENAYTYQRLLYWILKKNIPP